MSLKRIKVEQVCKPLDTYEEILMFVQNPPSWRTLCMELTQHSEYAIRNEDIPQPRHSNTNISAENYSNFEQPPTFCHFTPEIEKIKRHKIKKLPKALVCHDMANGYHDDRYIDGSGRYDAYAFYNWAAIDTFCYFSHHLITIPPLGWINVGHAHGVRVIGTVITEWDEGEKFWEQVLVSETKWKEFASMLVAIAKTLKFDGWLLNVENKVSSPEALLQFVQFLHRALHEQLPGRAQLIWYDSVTRAGKLHWQNGLNQHNKDFFEACDGIFTNYSWSEANVASSAEVAGERLTDVYVGIDVWGRNFLGGGKFNTQQAVKIAHKHGCSLAIFAPAWTHEAIPEESAFSSCKGSLNPEEIYEHFLLRDRAFWGSIWRYFNTKLPCELPFQTSFCRGQGLKRRLYGEVLGPVPWYNLRHMQYQLNAQHGPHGYLLTTVPNVLRVANQGVLRDQNGEVRLRESFHASKSLDKESQPKNSIESRDETAKLYTATKNSKDSVMDVLKNIYEESQNKIYDSNSGFPLSLSVSDLSKKDKIEFVLTPVPGEKECLELYLEDSFTGGSCLKINIAEMSLDQSFVRIFHSDFYVQDTLVACVVTKTLQDFENQTLFLHLTIENHEGLDYKVALVAKGAVNEDYQDEVVVCPINEPPSVDFKEVQKYLLLEEPGFYIPTFNPYEWNVRYYKVQIGGANVTSVSCTALRGQGPILLGHLGLCNMVQASTVTE